MTSCDAIIIGAGPNGLATALALASSRLKRRLNVAVVDGRDPRLRAGEDTRGTALTLATQRMFETLGVWAALEPFTAQMRTITVTDHAGENQGAAPVLLRFSTDDGVRAPAAIAENRALIQVLADSVAATPTIDLRLGSPVAQLEFGPGLAKVTLSSGTVLKGALVIGADGRSSQTRTAAGIATDESPYGQSAITFSVAHAGDHGGRAEEHFTPAGVLALLPLPGNRSSVVWAMEAGEAARLMALDDDAFLAAFTDQAGSHLGAFLLTTARQCYPLGLLLAKSMIAPRLALVGDAAHVIHPLAGLGLNLGFKDAAALADTLIAAQGLGQDIGSLAVLEGYARQRRFDTLATAVGMHGMNGLFANANPLLKAMRDAGLMMVNRLPLVKEALMREAAGTTGAVPSLMQGLLPS
jgi:2-octaprenyl-6-methoxyphenol hydroxylase